MPVRAFVDDSGSGGDSRYFVLMCGAGLDARIVLDASPRLKAKAGKLAYWTAGLSQLGHMVEQVEVGVNGRRHRCGFALASRVRNYGGDLEIASGAALESDSFEIVLFEGSHPLRYIRYLLGVGLRTVQRMPGVHVYRAQAAHFSGGAHLQIDGEYAGREPARIEIVPGALTLLFPY